VKHILRAAVLIVGPVALVIAFPWVFRAVVATSPATMALDRPQLFIPQSFGQYGHYRGDNVGEWIRLPATFSDGPAQCAACHTDKARFLETGVHNSLNCEGCHGPAEVHAQESPEAKPPIPEARELCLLCHRPVVGRPGSFPQIDPNRHAGGSECTLCHNPHSPEVVK